MRTPTIWMRMGILVAALIVFLGAALADNSFNVPAGDWNSAASWNQGRVPDITDYNVRVENGGIAAISSIATGGYGVCWVGLSGQTGKGGLTIGNGAELHLHELYNYGDIVQSAGTVVADIGSQPRVRTYGCGTYTQLGGTVQTPNFHVGQQGMAGQTSTYVLVSGAINIQSGGTHLMFFGEAAGAKGRFVHYDGIVTSPQTTMGGNGQTGYYEQYGGTNNSALLVVGDNGTGCNGYYIITNGYLNATAAIGLGRNNGATGTVYVGGTATVATPAVYIGWSEANGIPTRGYWMQDGGTVTVSSGMSVGHGPKGCVGTYTLGGGTLTTPSLQLGTGADSDGVFTQTGGVLRVTSACYIAGSSTTSNAYMRTQGGIFTIGSMAVGSGNSTSVTGRWDMSGGTVTVNNLCAGNGSGDASVINLSGGSLTVTNLYLGWNGGGIHHLYQSGGTNTAVSQCLIGRNGGAVLGAYHMTGGRLNAPVLAIGAGACAGLLHVVGMAPEIQATSFQPMTNGVLEITLDREGGIRPIALDSAFLNGQLTIGRTNGVFFTPGMVVTAMTYNSYQGAFAKTNFLDDVTCDVNYLSKMITLTNLRPLRRGTTVILR
ncbi:MAG: hypothetical protein PHR35_15620 [Kiritimatiellae bacterium]|nr:hypothetical protein [Kiritimatiellia bacterium]